VQDVFREISVEKNAKIYQSKNICLDGMEIGLLGQHQLKNAQVVMTACNALRDLGIILDDTHVRNGLSKARHMGRMEIMSENPTIILEGAHNLQGAEACAQNMRELFADKKITVIMGMMNDKELDKIVNTLALPAENVIFTKPHYDFRATDPQNLMDLLKDTKKQTFVEDNCVDAFELAEKITPKDGLILITGSLYLVGDIRAHLTKGGVSND
ncbi:MAG: hypothetical protein FWE44_03010, partial [Defluviitaleaceae bacterium]|nr:hypothetical protein [Defluviitaleaceae bacterium]